MSPIRLVLRNLLYFRAANLAVGAGVAVATAVLTGALMVGDSVRGSLRELAVRRLGPVDHALVATRFFPESLVDRLRADPEVARRWDLSPAIITRGGASNEGRTVRAAGVQIIGLGADGRGPHWVDVKTGQAVVNAEVADALAIAGPGSRVSLSLPAVGDTPREATLAPRGFEDVLTSMAVEVREVAREPGMRTSFSLEGSQRPPRNAWVTLRDLQRAIDEPRGVNAIFAHARDGGGDAADIAVLNQAVRRVARLGDFGLALERPGGGAEAVLNSRSTYIDPPVLDGARAAAESLSVPLREVSVYLVNIATKLSASGEQDAAIHYAIAAGLSDLDGKPLPEGAIALNEWAAHRLDAKVGDRIRLTYYQRQSDGNLVEVTSDRPGVGLTFRIDRIVPMTGLGADPSLTPEYPGLTDADSVSDWNPPAGVEIDRSKVTKEDEAYWDEYRAAPKLFVNLATAQRLWGGAYGDVTSLRVPDGRADAFARELERRLDPATFGLAFQPVKAQQLAAASGSTDFAMLFVGFSFFLIVAAALLVAMLFRLNVEQRARQIGLLGAVGFAPATTRRMALLEGMTLALVGGVIGLAGAVGYTWLMVAGLRTWWVDAVGTTEMRLHVEPPTLAIGLAASLVVAFIAILWGAWRVGRAPAARLLAGAWNDPQQAGRRAGRGAVIAGSVAAVAAIALVGSGTTGALSAQAAFLGGGAMFLAASLCLLTGALRPRRISAGARLSLPRLGFRNASRHTARSVLSAGLIAFAAFTLVAVASMKQDRPRNTQERESGAGGYRLILQADIPLLGDLNTRGGRDLVGVLNPDDPLWDRVRFMPMRRWQGQDVSCLNLTRPTVPTVLAVSNAMRERGGFTFAAPRDRPANPWDLLQSDGGTGDIPVIADNESAQYILKLKVGDTLDITDQRGRPQKLRLVATLSHSIFQSELLMSEANFLRLFPAQSGAGTVLIDTRHLSDAQVTDLRRRLETELEEYSVTVEATANRLATYAQVANTYLSTFQALGSLGLMLGTVGLAVVLLRGVVERRGELALLAALGFRRTDRLGIVLSENALPLVVGLLIGTACALVGILPALRTSGRSMNVPALGVSMASVFLVGIGALIVAVWVGQRHVRPSDLRAE